MNNNEIILYQPDGSISLEVRVENETVWLNRQQMALLFDRDVKTIGKHINNALKEELEHFFEDLCTIQEINSLVQRFDVALQLDQGLTYAQIANITHASTATISRVNRSLVYGAEGYRLAIGRMRETEKEDT